MSLGLQTRDVARVGTSRGERRILVCTGDPGLERALVAALSRRGAQLQVVGDRETYLAAAAREPFDAVLLDLGEEAETWQTELLEQRTGHAAVVVRVPAGREADALDALERGATSYTVGESSGEQIATLLSLAADAFFSEQRLSVAEGRLAALEAEDELVGHSPAMRRLHGVVSRAADNDATVLVEGKQGSGKTLVARCIHRGGRRAAEAFVVLQGDSCDEGAFDRALDAAVGGTLVVEDVEQLSSACQSRLVRQLKDTGSRGRSVRVVATTSARLAELTAKGSFREDLYYRLNMFPIAVPTLVERREDVPVLASRFLRRSSERTGQPDKGFTPAAMIVLEAHPWPGNVAQLDHAVTRAHGLADGGPIDRMHVFGPATGLKPPAGVKGFTDAIHDDEDDELTEDDILPFHEEEKRLLSRALQATKGNVRRAAQLLGIGRATLYRKIQIYQLRLQ